MILLKLNNIVLLQQEKKCSYLHLKPLNDFNIKYKIDKHSIIYTLLYDSN